MRDWAIRRLHDNRRLGVELTGGLALDSFLAVELSGRSSRVVLFVISVDRDFS
jgi:hypothetical protein